MKALVIGAGIGGLAAARGLLAAGHDVEVFEKAPTLRTSGAAFTLWSNGTGILKELAVDLDDLGAGVDYLEQRDSNGRVMLSIHVGHAVRRYGHPNISLPRRRLIERLATELPEGTLSFGRSAATITQDPGGVRVEFEDGEAATGDVLVGADGHHSAVRTHLWGGDPTEPSGWTTWQGLSPVDTEVTRGRTGLMIQGPEGLCGLMPAGAGLLQWWFDFRWKPGDVEPAAPIQELRRRFGHWTAPPVPELLTAVKDEEVEFFPHYGHRIPRTWGKGRITLAGDAAHTMPPTQAQGANQALEDAWALVQVLRNKPADVPEALRRYERARSKRASLIARVAGTEITDKYFPAISRLVPNAIMGPAYTRWLRQISNYLSSS
ncbi:FAD-dependent oxidoreductase [Actinomadura sp. 9N407]|uniref:FAD-dependent oxidoreductase n=1 Tax=Actinomadura sp. 9N407 TaxID=3375154 RepID=UPI0037A09A50